MYSSEMTPIDTPSPTIPPNGMHSIGPDAPTNDQSTQKEATQKACRTKTSHIRTANYTHC